MAKRQHVGPRLTKSGIRWYYRDRTYLSILGGDATKPLPLGKEGNKIGPLGSPHLGNVEVMRVGDEVILDITIIAFPEPSQRFSKRIPATTTVWGFDMYKNGKSLRQLLTEGEVYNHELNRTSWQ